MLVCLTMLHLVNSWLLGFTLWGRAEAILANEYVQRAQPQLQVFNAAQLQLALRHQVFRFGMPWWAYWYGQFPSFSPVPFVRFGHHFLKSDRTANHQRTQPNPTHEIAIPIFHSWDPSFFYNKKTPTRWEKNPPKKKRPKVLLPDFHQIALDRPAEFGPELDLRVWELGDAKLPKPSDVGIFSHKTMKFQ